MEQEEVEKHLKEFIKSLSKSEQKRLWQALKLQGSLQKKDDLEKVVKKMRKMNDIAVGKGNY